MGVAFLERTRFVLISPLGSICLSVLMTTASAGAQTASPEAPPLSTQASPPGQASGPEPWRFAVRPYLFLSGVTGSVTADPLTFPINSTLSDVVAKLKVGAFAAFTAEKGNWGVYADIQFISLAGEGSSARLDAELTLDNVIAEADLTLRPSAAPTLQFLAGVRVYSIDQVLSVTDEPRLESRTTVYDPILGAAGHWVLGEDFHFQIRSDIGGFGISSEFTYQLLMLLHWNVSETIGLPVGYRVLGNQINTGDIRMDTQMGGFVLGLDIRF